MTPQRVLVIGGGGGDEDWGLVLKGRARASPGAGVARAINVNGQPGREMI